MDPSGNRLRPSRWLEAVVKGNLDSQLRENVGEDPGLSAEHRELLVRALRGFLKNFGDSEAVSIVRAPGRINLIGMHVDHRGGCVNPVAIKETIVVAAPRRDDRVNLANESADFPPRSFRISEELPEKTVEDWDDWTARNLTALGSRGLAGDWSNYSRAAGLYLANRLRQPSYLSLEYVLAKEGLIPESVYSLTSVTLKTPRAYTNFIGNFTYRNIQKKLFCGYGVKMWQGKKIYLASKAKALFDYFYLNQAADPGRAVTDARINREGLTEKDLAELAEYTDLAKSRKMTKILQIMRAYVS